MEDDEKLSDRVRKRVSGKLPEAEAIFSPSLLEAMRLADLFESVKPTEIYSAPRCFSGLFCTTHRAWVCQSGFCKTKSNSS